MARENIDIMYYDFGDHPGLQQRFVFRRRLRQTAPSETNKAVILASCI